jgi:hypothetical protein
MFPDWVDKKYTHTFGITHWEATQRVMAAKLTILTHKIAIQLHLMAERELYYLQFLLQAASPETFGYILVFVLSSPWTMKHSPYRRTTEITNIFTARVCKEQSCPCFMRVIWILLNDVIFVNEGLEYVLKGHGSWRLWFSDFILAFLPG